MLLSPAYSQLPSVHMLADQRPSSALDATSLQQVTGGYPTLQLNPAGSSNKLCRFTAVHDIRLHNMVLVLILMLLLAAAAVWLPPCPAPSQVEKIVEKEKIVVKKVPQIIPVSITRVLQACQCLPHKAQPVQRSVLTWLANVYCLCCAGSLLQLCARP